MLTHHAIALAILLMHVAIHIFEAVLNYWVVRGMWEGRGRRDSNACRRDALRWQLRSKALVWLMWTKIQI